MVLWHVEQLIFNGEMAAFTCIQLDILKPERGLEQKLSCSDMLQESQNGFAPFMSNRSKYGQVDLVT